MIARTIKRIKEWYINTIYGLLEIEPEKPVQKAVPKHYPINLSVGDETITLNVTEESEEDIRMAAKRLSDDYNLYKLHYPDTPSETLYAIVALREAMKPKSKS